MTKPPAADAPAATQAERRNARLAQALRDNLARRKARARATGDADAADATDTAPSEKAVP
ncbi:MAG: hypothetical protein ACRCUI_01930 [Polymorphobacter sp.]